MPSAITQALASLIKSGNANNQPQTLSVPGQITVVDIYPQMKHLFSKNAQQTLNNKIYSLLHQYNELCNEEPKDKLIKLLYRLQIKSAVEVANYVRKVDVVYYFGSLVQSKDKLPLAVERVVNTLNRVADLGFTKGTLMPLGVVKLDIMDPCSDKWAVISYVTLTEVGKAFVDQNMPNMLFQEAGIPNSVENQ